MLLLPLQSLCCAGAGAPADGRLRLSHEQRLPGGRRLLRRSARHRRGRGPGLSPAAPHRPHHHHPAQLYRQQPGRGTQQQRPALPLPSRRRNGGFDPHAGAEDPCRPSEQSRSDPVWRRLSPGDPHGVCRAGLFRHLPGPASGRGALVLLPHPDAGRHPLALPGRQRLSRPALRQRVHRLPTHGLPQRF